MFKSKLLKNNKMANLKTDKVPSWAVGVVVVAGVLAFVGGGIFVYTKIKKAVDKKKEEEEGKAVTSDAKTELRNLLNSGVRLSNPESVYSSTANFIQQKLDGCELFTTELEVVNAILKVVKNRADWLKLVTDFGVRDIDNCGWLTGSTKYDLPTLLKDQLDSSTILAFEKVGSGTYNGLYKTYTLLTTELSKRGITI
jgi:predicted FMN-binding regulatory protein PaiB